MSVFLTGDWTPISRMRGEKTLEIEFSRKRNVETLWRPRNAPRENFSRKVTSPFRFSKNNPKYECFVLDKKKKNRLAKKKSKKKKYKEMYQLSFSAHLLTKTAQ